MTDGCPLCRADHLTRRRYEDDVCWIADCIICRVPMVVWKEHGASPPQDAHRHMLDTLQSLVAGRFGQPDCFIDASMRRIPDHYHAHARLGWRVTS